MNEATIEMPVITTPISQMEMIITLKDKTGQRLKYSTYKQALERVCLHYQTTVQWVQALARQVRQDPLWVDLPMVDELVHRLKGTDPVEQSILRKMRENVIKYEVIEKEKQLQQTQTINVLTDQRMRHILTKLFSTRSLSWTKKFGKRVLNRFPDPPKIIKATIVATYLVLGTVLLTQTTVDPSSNEIAQSDE